MILNRAVFADLDFGFKTVFNARLNDLRERPALWRQLALEVPSTGRGEKYVWANAFPELREWLDDAQFGRIQAYGYQIENKFWQDGLEVLREDLEDDPPQLGLIREQISTLAEAADEQPDDLIYQLLINGFDGSKGLAYDGQFFFDSDHPAAPGATQSNVETDRFNKKAFVAAVAQMRGLRDVKGRALSFFPTDLVVAPADEDAALEAINADTIDGTTNVWKGRVKVHVINRLAELSPDVPWFLFDLSKRRRPFIFQNRQAAQIVAQDRPEDMENFMRRILRWSAFARNNAGYGLWQVAFGSDGTTAAPA